MIFGSESGGEEAQKHYALAAGLDASEANKAELTGQLQSKV
jgi:hypothetical protein